MWNHQLQIKGAKLEEIQNQTWVTNSSANVTVTGVNVSPDSFSLTLQNQGTSNASFSSIVIGQVISLPVCKATPNGGSPRPADNGSVSGYVSVSLQQNYYVSNETVDLLGRVYPSPSSPNTTASVVVTDPNGVMVESINSSVELSGAFQAVFIAGGSVQPWVGGTYNVTVNYNGTLGSTTFEWGPAIMSNTTQPYTNSTTFTENIVNTTTSSLNTTTTTVNSTLSLPPRGNITVTTNATSYFGNEGVLVSGMVTPPPLVSNFSVNIRVINPEHLYVFSGSVAVASDGSFSVSIPVGNPMNGTSANYRSLWTNGTYTVYAYHEGLVTYTKFSWNGNYSVIAYSDSTSSS